MAESIESRVPAPKLDEEGKRRLLEETGPSFLQRIAITPTFLARLVRSHVISHEDRQDILAMLPSMQRHTLMEKLFYCSVEQFESFCHVLQEQYPHADIVRGVFGLQIQDLRIQRGAEPPALTAPQNPLALPGPLPDHGDLEPPALTAPRNPLALPWSLPEHGGACVDYGLTQEVHNSGLPHNYSMSPYSPFHHPQTYPSTHLPPSSASQSWVYQHTTFAAGNMPHGFMNPPQHMLQAQPSQHQPHPQHPQHPQPPPHPQLAQPPAQHQHYQPPQLPEHPQPPSQYQHHQPPQLPQLPEQPQHMPQAQPSQPAPEHQQQQHGYYDSGRKRPPAASEAPQHQDPQHQPSPKRRKDSSLERPSAASSAASSASTSSQGPQHQDQQQQPKPKRRKEMRGAEKPVHHCSFILEDEFDAGDGDLQSAAYATFTSNIERGFRIMLQDYTRTLLTVLTMCIIQLKRMVFLKIECKEGLSEEEIQQALLSSDNQLTRSSLRVCPGTLHFRDEISALLASDIIQKKHVQDPIGRRIDFDTQYVRLKILSQASLAVVKRDDLERPDKYQRSLQKRRSKDITDEKLIAPGEVNKYVLVRGRAGIGKSTLVQRLMRRWALGLWATHFKAIFLLSFRHLMAIVAPMDLAQLLRRHTTYTGQRDVTLHANWLEENQRQLGFVLDGLDEVRNFRLEWEKTRPEMSLGEEAPAITWAFALMKRMCLPESTIIVTSRPFGDLCCIKPTMMVEVMGLTRERVMEFVDKNVEPQCVDMVKETLESRPILLSVSSITFYCAALCRVLQDEVGVTDRLTTYTDITAYIMERYLRHSTKEANARGAVVDFSSSFQAMTKLAYEGLMKRKDGGLAQLVFDKHDLSKHNIQQHDVDKAMQSGMFMQTEVPGSDTKQVLGEFVHLSIQEFLAMIGLLMQSPAEVKEALEMLTSSGQFNMAVLFLYGFAFNRSSDAIKKLCAAMGIQLQMGDELSTILKKNIEGAKLHVLQIIHESQSPEIARLVGERRFKTKVNLTKTKMTMVDILALTFLLKHHHSVTTLRLEGAGLDAASVKELCQFLKGNTTITHVTIEDHVTDEGVRALSEVLVTNSTLKHLGLSLTEVTDAGLGFLSQALRENTSLTYLEIQGSVTDEGVRALSEVLVTNSTLTHLVLYRTKVTDVGLGFLSQALRENSTLIHLVTEVTDVGLGFLSQALRENTTLTHLELWLDDVTEAGIMQLCEALKTNTSLQELDVGMVLRIASILEASRGSLHQQLLDWYRERKAH